jgi:hypothetical protein
MAISSYIRKLHRVYRQRRIRRVAKTLATVGAIVLLFALEIATTFSSVAVTTLILVALAAVSLELVESKVYDIEEEVTTERGYRLHETPRQAYSALTEHIDSTAEGEKCVYLINYIGRGDITRNLITTAVEEGYDIYLLLKYPSTLDDSAAVADGEINEQVFRFVVQTLPPAFFSEHENMTIRFYPFPASINGVKIGDRSGGVGWYVISSADGQPRAQGREKLSPMLVWTEQSREYELLDQWFRGVFADIWERSFTLAELYERGDSKQLNTWVENHPDRREPLVAEMSEGHPEKAAELFGD